jgi:peroxiredoxin (alkyl hydroperoxide reductase subunit C)
MDTFENTPPVVDEAPHEFVRIGQAVKDMPFSAYNPVRGAFEDHSLSDFIARKRWLILVFYPADFTFVCPTELADVANHYAALQELGADVISVSTDTKFSHLAWHTSERLLENVRFLMAADPTGKMAQYFGVYDEKDGTAYRGTFIVSPEGLLVGTEVSFYNVGRNASELLRKMRANHYLADRPDEVCPAGWEEGNKTIKPSEKIVGNVFDAIKG